jgi:hypothetical protein
MMQSPWGVGAEFIIFLHPPSSLLIISFSSENCDCEIIALLNFLNYVTFILWDKRMI